MAREGCSPGHHRGSPVAIQGPVHVRFAVDKLALRQVFFFCKWFSLPLTLITPVFVCFPGRPRQVTDVLQPAGLLYRPLWTFQLWPPDAPAPTDAFRTLAAEVGTYGRGIGQGILTKYRLPRYI
jgi:hypothetical protein